MIEIKREKKKEMKTERRLKNAIPIIHSENNIMSKKKFVDLKKKKKKGES